MKNYQRVAAGALAALPFAAQAAVVTTDIEAAITDAGAAAAVVGLSVVIMLVGVKVYKWIRRAF